MLINNIFIKNINRYKLTPKFFILQIFPIGLEPSLKKQFEKIKKMPSNLNGKDDLLCICEECAKKYFLNPNVESYEYMVNIKENLSSSTNLSKKSNEVGLEDNINDILNSLCNINPSQNNEEELRNNPLTLANKIYDLNIDLKKHITENLCYYRYIKNLFESLDANNNIFEIIAQEVKLCFKKLDII